MDELILSTLHQVRERGRDKTEDFFLLHPNNAFVGNGKVNSFLHILLKTNTELLLSNNVLKEEKALNEISVDFS